MTLLATRPSINPSADNAFSRLVRDVDRRIRDGDDPLRERDLATYGLSPATVRRRFLETFGQTLAAYQRERRIARAHATLRAEPVIMAQVDAGFASASGFREAYAKVFKAAPSGRAAEPLFMDWVDTPLGRMVVVGDDAALHLAEFTDRKALPRQVRRIRTRSDRPILQGSSAMTQRFAGEVAAYFSDRAGFSVPIALHGTPFQEAVWTALRNIPAGTTATYGDFARDIGSPRAVRAAASSNAANALALVVPCHRVVPKGGGVGGYAGGAERKRWLLRHEGADI